MHTVARLRDLFPRPMPEGSAEAADQPNCGVTGIGKDCGLAAGQAGTKQRNRKQSAPPLGKREENG